MTGANAEVARRAGDGRAASAALLPGTCAPPFDVAPFDVAPFDVAGGACGVVDGEQELAGLPPAGAGGPCA